ncbi:MAG TPA: hypothetical protein VF834_11930 [Streptosporangiaceae bacterium]
MTQRENGPATADNGARWLAAAWRRSTSGVWPAMALLGLVLAAWVAMSQISLVVAEVTPSRQYSVSDLLGVGQLGSLTTPPRAALMAWDQALVNFPRLTWWLAWYAVMALLFAAGVTGLGLTILKGRYRVTAARRLLWMAAGLFVADAAAAAIIVGSAQPSAAGQGIPGILAWLLHVLTVLKWVVVIILAALSVDRLHSSYESYRDSGRRADHKGIYADLRRLVLALKVQRFSAVVVLLLGLIAIGPRLNDVFEQIPDVERAWLNGSFTGISQLLISALAQVMLALLLFLLGRMRLRRAEQKQAGHELRPPAHHWSWLVLPAATIVVAAGLGWSGQAAVAWKRVSALCVVLVVIAAASKVIQYFVDPDPGVRKGSSHQADTAAGWRERSYARRAGWEHQPGHVLPGRSENGALVALCGTVGDVLAVVVVAVTAIGAVRAFTVLAMVSGTLLWDLALAAGIVGAFALPILLPLAWTVLGHGAQLIGRHPGPMAAPVRRALDRRARGEQPLDRRPAPVRRLSRFQRLSDARQLAGDTRVIWVVAAPFILADLWLLLMPLLATHVIGALGTAVIALGSLASLLSALAYLAQTRLPLPVFRLLRLNATPVMTIVLVIGIFGGLLDSNSALHRVPPVPWQLSRPTFAGKLATWLRDMPASCAVPTAAVVGGHQVRVVPLVQVAAEGGGIRAAWWTVGAMSTIARTPCGVSDVFAVSSVSGGSVGMAVLASVPGGVTRPVSAAQSDISAMAGPDALATAVDGLLLRDTLAGYTGIDLRAAGMYGAARFPDRAALIARVWQNQDSALGHRFLGQSGWLHWALLFNSTSVGTGCRAIISTVRLPLTTPAAPGRPCGLGTAGPAGSYDFFRRLPCMRGLTMETAALLSARYAYITPSATIDRCSASRNQQLADQLVDGGYGEASGLSTLADLAPALMAGLRLHNDAAIAAAGAGQPVTLVVPVTVDLRNSIQSAPVIAPLKRTPEPRAVSTALSNGPVTELTSTAALLQNMLAVTGPSQWADCASTDQVCASMVRAAQSAVPNQLITVAPRADPGVAAPLGWQLSPASEQALGIALRKDAAAAQKCGQYQSSYASSRPYCLPGNGGLADLLGLLGGG